VQGDLVGPIFAYIHLYYAIVLFEQFFENDGRRPNFWDNFFTEKARYLVKNDFGRFIEKSSGCPVSVCDLK
jgi:hypothetical protein